MLQFELYEWPEIEPLRAMGATISKCSTTVRVDWFGDCFSAHASHDELYFQDVGYGGDLEIYYDFDPVRAKFAAAAKNRIDAMSRAEKPTRSIPDNILDANPHHALLPVGVNAELTIVHRFTNCKLKKLNTRKCAEYLHEKNIQGDHRMPAAADCGGNYAAA